MNEKKQTMERLPVATFVSYKIPGDSFQFGDDVLDKEFMVEYNMDLSKLKEAHDRGSVRHYLLSHNDAIASQKAVTLKAFTHMKLSLWPEVVSVYAARPYIQMNEWLSIQDFVNNNWTCIPVQEHCGGSHLPRWKSHISVQK